MTNSVHDNNKQGNTVSRSASDFEVLNNLEQKIREQKICWYYMDSDVIKFAVKKCVFSVISIQ